MTNAAKQSLEEKIVQNLKEEKIYALLGDEDALTDLVKRAIHEALFQPTYQNDSYGRVTTTKDSIVVAAAKEVAQRAATKIVQDMVAEIMANEQIKAAVNLAIAQSIPAAISGSLNTALSIYQQNTVADAFVKVTDAIRNRTI